MGESLGSARGWDEDGDPGSEDAHAGAGDAGGPPSTVVGQTGPLALMQIKVRRVPVRASSTHHHAVGARHGTAQPTRLCALPFDARGIARRFRHSAIFGALGALQPGEAMRFVNDHDPLPLLDQLRERW